MKAVLCRRYGPTDALTLEDVPDPEPGKGEIRIRVRAAGLNPFDWHCMRGEPYFLRLMTGPAKPKDPRFGVDVAGEVDAVGEDVRDFRVGDAVFGSCRGAAAELACARAADVVGRPENVSWEQAAAVPIAGYTAVQALRDAGRVRAGDAVLVNGASGGVGTFAVQVARALDASVTGICSARNVDLVRSLGAERVIDYATEDVARSGDRWDVVVEAVGNRPLEIWRRLLKPRGRLVVVGGKGGRWFGPLGRLLAAAVASRFSRRKSVTVMGKRSRDDLAFLAGLMRAGKMMSVVDRSYPLEEIADAVRYLETGHARGKVVVVTGEGVSSPTPNPCPVRAAAYDRRGGPNRDAKREGRMPRRPTLGHGKICYVEIPAADIARSAEFYRAVFGWEIRRRGDGATAFDDGVGQVSGAWVTGRPPAGDPGLLIYVMVNDAAETVERVRASGGVIVQEIGRDAPEITARFRDPAGNVLGIYQEHGDPADESESSIP